MSLQTCRFYATIMLAVVVVIMPGFLFCRWMFPTSTPDISVLNDYWSAGLYFVFAIAVPAVAFILANTKINSFQTAGNQEVRQPLAWFALIVLCAACAYILIAAILLFFLATKEHTDCIKGLGEFSRTIRYPIDEAMNIICTFFGPLITFALSMDVLSLPLLDKPRSSRRK